VGPQPLAKRFDEGRSCLKYKDTGRDDSLDGFRRIIRPLPEQFTKTDQDCSARRAEKVDAAFRMRQSIASGEMMI
jgi:hypothetical protein